MCVVVDGSTGFLWIVKVIVPKLLPRSFILNLLQDVYREFPDKPVRLSEGDC